jgi:hypothetical protein
MTPVERVFDWLEHTDLSLWVRGESLLAFPTILSVHTIGMGFLAGTSAAIALRMLGVAKGVPLPALVKFYPVLWLAFAANAASGVLLFAGYPYKAASNPVFYVKLALIAAGLVLAVRIRDRVLLVPSPDPRLTARLASLSLAAWGGAILAGRLLAYTFTWLRVGVPGGF